MPALALGLGDDAELVECLLGCLAVRFTDEGFEWHFPGADEFGLVGAAASLEKGVLLVCGECVEALLPGRDPREFVRVDAVGEEDTAASASEVEAERFVERLDRGGGGGEACAAGLRARDASPACELARCFGGEVGGSV